MLKSELRAVFGKYGKQMVMSVQDRIIRDNTNASGDALRSLSYEISDTTIDIIGNKYIEALDKGRGKGKTRPPVYSILQWIQSRGIKQYSSTKRKMKDRDLAYVIARKIGEKGTLKRYGNKGTNLLDYVVNKYAEPLQVDIMNIIDKEITNAIQEL